MNVELRIRTEASINTTGGHTDAGGFGEAVAKLGGPGLGVIIGLTPGRNVGGIDEQLEVLFPGTRDMRLLLSRL